jgi:hypothetical protein
MTHTGRKPLGPGHVDRLTGSAAAKQRMKVLLETLLGKRIVPEACAELGIGESRFHALRNRWLQQALELLEPRPIGRPPHQADAVAAQAELAALETENRALRQQLAAAEVQRELAEALPQVVHSADPPQKKTAARPSRRRRSP